MRLYYQPKGYWFGDCMPFGKGDTFYLFHQRDTRKPCPFGEPFGWDLATTKDFVTYEDCGTAILRGDDTKQDQFIFAGSVCEDRDGVYHAFYTGFNRDYPKQGKPSQVLMHAISHDLKNWEKTNDAVTFTPQPGYDPDDWRDPFVLWDDEENQYILILGTRLAGDKHRQTGRTVYFTSADLTNWTFQGDFWAPDLFTMHEMPDLFKIGEWWYLVTTEYSHASKQVYRMAKSLKGPWIAPEDDGFDGRAYYAGRTFELKGQRILFGWVPSRANETDCAHLTYDEDSDNEQFIWAGTFVAHEIYQREDGTLGCRVPQTVWDAFKETNIVLADETLERESGRVTKQVVSNAGDCYRFETTVTAKDGLRSFSVGLRNHAETGVSYCFTVLCAQNRVIFEKVPNWPWPQMNNIGLERPVHPNEDGTYHIQIIADDTIATLYINGVALNARMYTQPGDGIVLAAEDGKAAFTDMSFAKLSDIDHDTNNGTNAVKTYGFSVQAVHTENGQDMDIVIQNQNHFRINEIAVTVTNHAAASDCACVQKNQYHIASLAAGESWHSKDAKETENKTGKASPFVPFAYYEGKEQIIDPSLYDEEKGIYQGEPHHALVWPDEDNDDTENSNDIKNAGNTNDADRTNETDEKWKRTLSFEPVPHVQVTLEFIARGPRVAFCGHSFTGLWDSAYYYFRELAKAAGWNAQIAYSYWGGTGISRYAGLTEGCGKRAAQCDALLDANDYYDYFVIAGNSDEAVEKKKNASGEVIYAQRETMLRGAQIFLEKAKKKQATLALWAPHAYKYGFLQNMGVKPWKKGNVGDQYEKDGTMYTLTLTNEDMAKENLTWYQHMAEVLGEGTIVLPVCEAYRAVTEKHPTLVDPYLEPGVECGDNGHQNNLGNYISACVCFQSIFGTLPSAVVPKSHTSGLPGGSITKEQAEAIIHALANQS